MSFSPLKERWVAVARHCSGFVAAVTFCERRRGKWDGIKDASADCAMRDALNASTKSERVCNSYRRPERLPGGIFAVDGQEEELNIDYSGKDRNLI